MAVWPTPPTVQEKDGSGDTYNFYFQKGGGPGKVEQGGAATPPTAPVVEPAPRVTAPLPAAVFAETEPSRFEAQAELVMTPQRSGSGLALGGQFQVSPQFGLQVHLISLAMSDGGGNSSNFSAEGSDDVTTKISAVGGSVAAAYSPFSGGALGLPVRVSVLLGGMVLSEKKSVEHDTFSAEGKFNRTDNQTSAKGLAFAGLSATALLGAHLGAVADVKLTSDPAFSQIGVGLAYVF